MTANHQRFECLHEIVNAARDNLNADIWDYFRGGTDSEKTVMRNRLALIHWRFARACWSTSPKSPAARASLATIALAGGPGAGRLVESFAEGGGVTAHAGAAEFGAGFCISSVSSFSLEDVAAAGNGLKIFQLYKRGDADWADAIVERAIAAGYDAFCFTVDSAFYSRRERDIAKRFVKPWVASSTGRDWQAQLNWDDIKRYKDKYELPLALKGIQHRPMPPRRSRWGSISSGSPTMAAARSTTVKARWRCCRKWSPPSMARPRSSSMAAFNAAGHRQGGRAWRRFGGPWPHDVLRVGRRRRPVWCACWNCWKPSCRSLWAVKKPWTNCRRIMWRRRRPRCRSVFSAFLIWTIRRIIPKSDSRRCCAAT